MNMVRLVYVSQMTEECDTEALEAILKVSRQNNQARDITGFLCYDPEFFMQCLEGPRAGVNELYARIHNDKRHTRVTLLEYSDTVERLFPNWSMAFVNARNAGKELLGKYFGKGRFNPYLLTGDQARSFLVDLARESKQHIS